MASVLLLALPAWGQAPSFPAAAGWTSSYENEPAGSDFVALGDDHFRTKKKEIRARLEVEHQFGVGANHDNGLHRLGSARCYMMNAAPTGLGNEEAPADHTATDFDYTQPGGAGNGPTLSVTESNTNKSANFNSLGLGRCWIDLDGRDGAANTPDDNLLYIYDEAGGGWLPIVAFGPEEPAGNPVNLIYNGGFNDGVDTDTALPTGWTQINGNETVTVNNVNKEDGAGLEVRVTTITNPNDGLEQTLVKLKNNTRYRVTARVNQNGVGVCTVATSGGAANASVSTSGAGRATISDTFDTNTTVSDVTLQLRSGTAGDRCDWISVGVYEVMELTASALFSQPDYVAPPGPVADQVTETVTAAISTSVSLPAVKPSVTVPAPGGFLVATGSVTVLLTGGHSAFIDLRFTDSSGTTVCDSLTIFGAAQSTHAVTPYCVIENPIVGSFYTIDILVTANTSASYDDMQRASVIWYPGG